MPKRIVDGDGLWRSDKLANVRPEWIKAEYANLIPLALANGSFEANTRRIWSVVYSYNRPEIRVEQVEQIIAEFERVKLLFRWTDQESGKPWGYWTRIDKPGRLPGKSRRGRNEAVGLEPPAEELGKSLESNGIHTETIGQPTGTDLRLGFGSGSGLGSGINPLSEQKNCSDVEVIPLKKPKTEPSREAIKLASLLKAEILRNRCDFTTTQAQDRNWVASADRMLRIDKRNPEEAAELIQWAQRDEFWKGNILSMDKFREKFVQLALKAEVKTTSKGTAPVPLPTNYVPASEQIRREREQQRQAAVPQ